MPNNFVNKVINAKTEYQLKSYQKQKEAIIEIHNPSWERLELDIDSRHSDIQEYIEAISKHAPELLSTLQERDEYRSSQASYFEHIALLQNQLEVLKTLAHTQSVTSKNEMQKYKELLKQETSDLEKKAAEVFKQLTQHMSDLLHRFAEVLLRSIERTRHRYPLARSKELC